MDSKTSNNICWICAPKSYVTSKSWYLAFIIFAQSKCGFTKSMPHCAILFKTIDALTKMPSLINTSRIEVKCSEVKATWCPRGFKCSIIWFPNSYHAFKIDCSPIVPSTLISWKSLPFNNLMQLRLRPACGEYLFCPEY